MEIEKGTTVSTNGTEEDLKKSEEQPKLFDNCAFLYVPSPSVHSQFKFLSEQVRENGAKLHSKLTSRNYNEITHYLINSDVLKSANEVLDTLNMKYIASKAGNSSQIIEVMKKAEFLDSKWVNDSVLKGHKVRLSPYKIDSIYETLSNLIDDNSPSRKRRKIRLPSLHDSQNDKDKNETKKTKFYNKPDWIRTVLNDNSLHAMKLQNNRNLPVLKALSRLRSLKELSDNDFRVNKYKTAINSLLLNPDNKVTTAKEAGSLVGISANGTIAKKIEEFYKTGTIADLELLEKNPENKILRYLKDIHGVGLKTAKNLKSKYHFKDAQHFKDLVSSGVIQLNDVQKLGLKYYEDWTAKIPRANVKLHYDFLQNFVKSIDDSIEMIVMGSYRRGLKETGDIDFIVTKKSWSSQNLESSKLIDEILSRLNSIKYIECILSQSRTKFILGARYPSSSKFTSEENKSFAKEEHKICRRVDFLFTPYNELGAHLMYFTGNSIFNRMSRLLAHHEGFKLNQHGIFKRSAKQLPRKDKNHELDILGNSDLEEAINDTEAGELIESFDEKMIFKILGLKWCEPEARNIGDIDIL